MSMIESRTINQNHVNNNIHGNNSLAQQRQRHQFQNKITNVHDSSSIQGNQMSGATANHNIHLQNHLINQTHQNNNNNNQQQHHSFALHPQNHIVQHHQQQRNFLNFENSRHPDVPLKMTYNSTNIDRSVNEPIVHKYINNPSYVQNVTLNSNVINMNPTGRYENELINFKLQINFSFVFNRTK